MIDAFGPVGTNGLFADCLRKAMTVLRQNRDTLLSVLEPFVKDPIIDWKKSKGGQRQGSLENGIRDTTQAKLSLKMIDERLRGIYNLRNPNFKKITRTDHVASDHDEEMARMVPLSVEGQVHKMISEATSHENLVQLYIGWMPWI